ncbi:MAG: hypothetical protein ACKVVP_03595 [Chloroflexota bacterium]
MSATSGGSGISYWHWRIVPLVCLALLVAVLPAFGGDLTLEPSGTRTHTTAEWVSETNEQSTEANEVLYLEKRIEDPFVGAVVAVKGLDGAAPSEIRNLSWDRREDSICNASEPRWGIGIEGLSGTPHVVYLGCLEAEHEPSTDDHWVRDEFSAEMIQRAVRSVGGADAVQGQVRAVAILFTQEPTERPAVAYIDNVQVNEVIWRQRESENTARPTLSRMTGIDRVW